jgi:glycosyltransferase involved in cell wall biosynthesis
MHVMIVSSGFATPRQPQSGGGSAIVAQSVARWLAARGHRVTVLTGSPPTAEDEVIDGVRVVGAAKPNLYRWTEDSRHDPLSKLAWHALEDQGPASAKAAQLIHGLRPDVLATHNLMGLGTQLWQVAAELGVPIVHTLHDHYLICPRTTCFRGDAACPRPCLDCRILTSRRRASSRLLARVIGVSRYILERHVAAGLFEDMETEVVPNGADAPPTPAQCDYDGSRPLRIGFLGRGNRLKGLGVLIAAFDRMADGRSRLLVGGTVHSDMQAALNGMRRRAEVELLGPVQRDAFFAGIDVLAVPSIQPESYSLVTAEAVAFGRAVVGSDLGGIPEAIGGEDHGWLIPPGDAAALARLLSGLVASPELLAQKAGRGRPRRVWSTSDAADAHLAAYAAVAGRTG